MFKKVLLCGLCAFGSMSGNAMNKQSMFYLLNQEAMRRTREAVMDRSKEIEMNRISYIIYADIKKKIGFDSTPSTPMLNVAEYWQSRSQQESSERGSAGGGQIEAFADYLKYIKTKVESCKEDIKKYINSNEFKSEKDFAFQRQCLEIFRNEEKGLAQVVYQYGKTFEFYKKDPTTTDQIIDRIKCSFLRIDKFVNALGDVLSNVSAAEAQLLSNDIEDQINKL